MPVIKVLACAGFRESARMPPSSSGSNSFSVRRVIPKRFVLTDLASNTSRGHPQIVHVDVLATPSFTPLQTADSKVADFRTCTAFLQVLFRTSSVGSVGGSIVARLGEANHRPAGRSRCPPYRRRTCSHRRKRCSGSGSGGGRAQSIGRKGPRFAHAARYSRSQEKFREATFATKVQPVHIFKVGAVWKCRQGTLADTAWISRFGV